MIFSIIIININNSLSPPSAEPDFGKIKTIIIANQWWFMFMFTTNKLDLAVIIFTCNVCTMLAVVPSQIWLCIFCLKQKLIFGYQKTGEKMFKKIKFKTIDYKKGT